jgi:hypothetical protein
MRPLRQHANVLDVAADLDECIGVAVFPAPLIVVALRLGQGLERASDYSGTDRVDPTLEGEGAIFVGTHLQSARLGCAALLGGKFLGVGSVPHVKTEVPEPADAVLAGFLEQLRLLEGRRSG